jgi:hypothetical protein
MKWYSKFFGISPKGYRAPNGLISKQGLARLAERGFVYDSSVFPSFRFDKYGYNNTSLPTDPFIYRVNNQKLIEFPFAVVSKVRLVLSISYLKLFGLNFFKQAIKFFGLPDILIIDSHPYDFFMTDHLHRIKGWKRLAHARNAKNTLSLFDGLLETLKNNGYNFVYIDELLEHLNPDDMAVVDI